MKLDHWDRNAPLPFAPTGTIPWTDARDMVLSAYGAFLTGDGQSIAKRLLRPIAGSTRRFVPGKSPGAPSAHPTVPSAHPYVLLNYQGKPRDVMTLAHELGHGVHQVLAAPQRRADGADAADAGRNRQRVRRDADLQTRATRTAKTDPSSVKAMLAGKVEDMINTVVRQIAFYSFERKLFTSSGVTANSPRSSSTRALDQKCRLESLGPAIEIKPGYENFWMYIPHFIHSPFYVYAYAFGDCLVNSLYAVYENAQEGFAERYLAMLAAGGTKHYSELLKPFGLDAKDPAFWDGGLSVISGMIDELEAMG
jgi:oligoendopeptidase F